MTNKTEAQPEALRLEVHQECADFATSLRSAANTVHLEGKKVPPSFLRAADLFERASAELRRQHAEIEHLRALAATCYAGLGGECDLPVIWLDALNDAANGEPFDTDGLLPYTSAIRAQLTTQTNRASAAEQQVTALTQRLAMANRLNTDARENLAQLSARQAAPDGWRLVPVEATRSMMAAAVISKEGNAVYKNLEARYLEQMEREHGDAYDAMLSAAPPPPEREPLSETQVRGLLESAGYWPGEDSQRADFINGLRYGEMAHGIKGEDDGK